MTESRSPGPAVGTALMSAIHTDATDAGLGAHAGGYLWRQSWFSVPFAGFFGLLGLYLAMTPGAHLIGVIFLVPALLGLVSFVRGRIRMAKGDRRLDLFERGAIVTNRAQDIAVFRYATARVTRDIVRQTSSIGSAMEYSYTLREPGGPKVSANGGTRLHSGFDGPTEWGPAIVSGIANTQLPAARQAIAAGNRLNFGPVWISATEVGNTLHTWRWPEIATIWINNYVNKGHVELFLRVKPKKAVMVEAAKRVENLAIFMTLADELIACG
ncbi:MULTISPECIES: DUF6585 family protein [unclassified Mycobacterium]|uniref:DUF6585 family protein n=1 Tax=unclassified Mycobacterium TaxID=2642494 RepID=UPI0009922EC0|nr:MULTISPECIES: DUF6585 family protein [unclassified Mycobacterium]